MDLGPPASSGHPQHGRHTLQVHTGAVVGRHGRDVFVELGPRMQGVIDVSAFAAPPEIGATHEYTLRGQEEGLWVLQLAHAQPLVTWERMEVGSLVQAHVVRLTPGGLEVKIGPLHAFLPRSHTGLDRTDDPRALVGRTFTCEVIEVDARRQRVTVSRKLVVQRERESEHSRLVGALKPGDVVQGRVTRIEPYGAFVAFGKGLTGLVHVSNLAHEHVEDVTQLVRLGQALDLRVLHIKQGGKRIGLGLKQMVQSPWEFAHDAFGIGEIVVGRVTRVIDAGVFVSVRQGIEGFLPFSQTGFTPGRVPDVSLAPGSRVSVRVVELDPPRERMLLSLLTADGRRIFTDEAENLLGYRERERERATEKESGSPGLPNRLGDKLRHALRDRDDETEKRAS